MMYPVTQITPMPDIIGQGAVVLALALLGMLTVVWRSSQQNTITGIAAVVVAVTVGQILYALGTGTSPDSVTVLAADHRTTHAVVRAAAAELRHNDIPHRVYLTPPTFANACLLLRVSTTSSQLFDSCGTISATTLPQAPELQLATTIPWLPLPRASNPHTKLFLRRYLPARMLMIIKAPVAQQQAALQSASQGKQLGFRLGAVALLALGNIELTGALSGTPAEQRIALLAAAKYYKGALLRVSRQANYRRLAIALHTNYASVLRALGKQDRQKKLIIASRKHLAAANKLALKEALGNSAASSYLAPNAALLTSEIQAIRHKAHVAHARRPKVAAPVTSPSRSQNQGR